MRDGSIRHKIIETLTRASGPMKASDIAQLIDASIGSTSSALSAIFQKDDSPIVRVNNDYPYFYVIASNDDFDGVPPYADDVIDDLNTQEDKLTLHNAASLLTIFHSTDDERVKELVAEAALLVLTGECQ